MSTLENEQYFTGRQSLEVYRASVSEEHFHAAAIADDLCRSLECASEYVAKAQEALHYLAMQVPVQPGAGVYLLHRGAEVVYVGQSINVMGRMAGHKRKDFDRVGMIPLDRSKSLLSLVETLLIHVLAPEYNIRDHPGDSVLSRTDWSH